MANNSHEELLNQFFKQVVGVAASTVAPLRPHASERHMYRLAAGPMKMIGVVNPIRRENDAFVSFARYFRSCGLPVPEIYHYEPDHNMYLEEDLGDETLFDLLLKERLSSQGEVFPSAAGSLYRASLEYLPRFQIDSAARCDFSLCYPEKDLLPGTFAGDCAAFATELVLRLLPHFDISRLANNFAALIAFLSQAKASYFVYRDFQSRNIMHHRGQPYFIDFQSGRRGPLQYDVVSLLYQSSTKIPQSVREDLLKHYVTSAMQYTHIDEENFYRFFGGFIISRMVQVLGVYGRQGLGAGKSYFLDSIPAAIETLQNELQKPSLPIALHALRACVDELAQKVLRGTPS